MWTTKQANLSATILELLSGLVFVAFAVHYAIVGDWIATALWAVIGGYVAYRSMRRRRRRPDLESDGDALAGRARDERDAYIQLRAWAMVGQVAFAAIMVLVAVDALRDTSQTLIVCAFAALALVHFGSVSWLRSRG